MPSIRMILTTGTKLGAYEIVAPLGAGGMGEVYRARDSKLKREVAIKVLPDLFSGDAERVARFQREAEVLASLNHPHIAAIYDVAEFGESRFLVLELVEGETLAERITRGPVPIGESLAIARQVAEALEAAHERGVIHRDLKPANIKIGPEGNVKVLDFGLAKVGDTERAEDLSNTPTQVTATAPGMIFGTPAYMSPEQAKGKATDRTTDVWALGCVLYEMLTGRRVFEGDAVVEILAGVFKAEPDWHRLPAETPEGIRRLLRRCLRKDRKLRLHDIADARIEIDETQSGPDAVASDAPIGPSRRERLLWIAALALLTTIAVIMTARAFRTMPTAPEVRLEITTPPTADVVSLAMSPDGRQIVFVATSDGRPRLWVRALDSVSMRPLTGTDFAAYPFWSPDSRSIGFFADGRLKRIDVEGGAPQVLANASNSRGGAWNHDGTILFSGGGTGPIFRIPATGGPALPLTKPGPQHQSHRFPQVLPDGRHFLYYVLGSPEVRGIYVGQFDGSEPRRVMDSETAAVYASSGQLLFVRQGTLFAQDFDVTRLALVGDPFRVAEQVFLTPSAIQFAAVSVSAAGPIAYRAGSVGVQRHLVWFDRSGKEIAKAGDPDGTNHSNPAMSADGHWVAWDRTGTGNVDVWMMDLERRVPNRFTSAPSIDAYPTWSPDGKRIVFGSFRKGAMDLYLKLATGVANEEPLLSTLEPKAPTDWSPDGRFLLYRSSEPNDGYDLWALPLDRDGKPGKPFPVAQTASEERDGQFSPDGKWIAYESNESDRSEIYVQQFPSREGKVRISTNGGAQARWARDGKELFYVALDGRLMTVPIRFTSNGRTIEAGVPAPLFPTHLGGALQGASRQQYMVSPDGNRFLMNTIAEDTVTPITVVLNWKARP